MRNFTTYAPPYWQIDLNKNRIFYEGDKDAIHVKWRVKAWSQLGVRPLRYICDVNGSEEFLDEVCNEIKKDFPGQIITVWWMVHGSPPMMAKRYGPGDGEKGQRMLGWDIDVFPQNQRDYFAELKEGKWKRKKDRKPQVDY